MFLIRHKYYLFLHNRKASSFMKFLRPSAILLFLVLLYPSCQQSLKQAEEAYLQQLLEQTKALHCRIADLSIEAKSLWDTVNTNIEARLPAAMPEHYRINLLRLRNARMIKEFDVYPLLGDDVHRLVDSAELMDVQIADKMRAAMDSLSVCDSLSQKMMVELAEKQPELYTDWKYKFIDVNCLKSK